MILVFAYIIILLIYLKSNIGSEHFCPSAARSYFFSCLAIEIIETHVCVKMR